MTKPSESKSPRKLMHTKPVAHHATPAQSVDEFLARGGRIEVLPGFQQVAPGPGQVHFAQRGRAA